MNLKIGDIVRVSGKDSDRYKHWNKQGLVVGFDPNDKEDPVRVWFGRECDYLLVPEFRMNLSRDYAIVAPTETGQVNDMRTWNYPESVLQKEAEWSMRTLAERYFPRFYHSYCEPKNAFVAGKKCCDVKGCGGLIAQRIVFNIWGIVDFADVCERHAKEYHGKSMDEFPYRKSSKSK